MSVQVSYKGSNIVTINTNTTKKLLTKGKYCEDDITLENTQDGGVTPSGNLPISANGTYDVTNYATVTVLVGNDNIKIWKVVVNNDITTSGEHSILSGDSWIISNYNKSDLVAGYFPITNISANCCWASIKSNTTYGSTSADRQYGFFIQGKTSGPLVASTGTPLNSTNGSRSEIFFNSSGDIKISASSTYPLRAGTYLVWAILTNGIN